MSHTKFGFDQFSRSVYWIQTEKQSIYIYIYRRGWAKQGLHLKINPGLLTFFDIFIRWKEIM